MNVKSIMSKGGTAALVAIMAVLVATGGAFAAYSDDTDTVTHWVVDSDSELQQTWSSDGLTVSDGVAQVSGSTGEATYSDVNAVASADKIRINVTALTGDNGTAVIEVADLDYADTIASKNITSTGVATIDLPDVSDTSVNYGVNVVTTDENTSVSYDYIALTSPNTAPTAEVNQDVESPTVGETVTLDASGSSDPDGDNLTYEWREQTGATTSGTTMTFTPEYNGTYEFTLTVTDEHGATNSTTIGLSVEDAPTEYDATFNVTSDGEAVENATVEVNNQTLTTDENGSAVVSLVDGDYNYTISADGYDDASDSLTVNGSAQTVDVMLSETSTATETPDDESGVGFVPENGVSALVVIILILGGGAILLGEGEQ